MKNEIKLFREEGLIVEVEIMKHKSDEMGEVFTLKCRKQIQSGLFGDMPIGTIFSVFRAHDAGAYAGWSLSSV